MASHQQRQAIALSHARKLPRPLCRNPPIFCSTTTIEFWTRSSASAPCTWFQRHQFSTTSLQRWEKSCHASRSPDWIRPSKPRDVSIEDLAKYHPARTKTSNPALPCSTPGKSRATSLASLPLKTSFFIRESALMTLGRSDFQKISKSHCGFREQVPSGYRAFVSAFWRSLKKTPLFTQLPVSREVCASHPLTWILVQRGCRVMSRVNSDRVLQVSVLRRC
jgi:hypothetical protein